MTDHAAVPVGGRTMTTPVRWLTAIVVLLTALVIWRFAVGLGPATGLNDGYPWGLWIAFDVVTGTALACGGYAIAFLVYILNRGRYHPLVRPAILTSALGYSVAAIGIEGAYLTSFVLFAAGTVLVLSLRTPLPATGSPGVSILRGLLEVVRHAVRTPSLAAVIAVTVVMNLLGFPYISMVPVIARDVIGLEASATGLFFMPIDDLVDCLFDGLKIGYFDRFECHLDPKFPV